MKIPSKYFKLYSFNATLNSHDHNVVNCYYEIKKHFNQHVRRCDYKQVHYYHLETKHIVNVFPIFQFSILGNLRKRTYA